MAPRAASSAKRKLASESSSEDVSDSASAAKKAKTREVEVAGNGQPTNKALPAHIQFPPRTPDALRIVAWNVCGLAASQKKGFKQYIDAEDPDVLVLTETKVNNEPADPELSRRFPYRYWSISGTKGYAGTAILSKHKPLAVTTTLPGHPQPASVKGRIVTLEFEHCYLVGTYVVNAGTGLKTLDAKNEWNEHFEVYMRELDSRKAVIWTGDLNVAPTELDLANAKRNWNKTAGYTEAETSAFARILKAPGCEEKQFVDIWRERHGDVRHYTYFSYRFNCRTKGLGWRLDMFVVSERIAERVRMCEIRSEIYGASDHCPVVLEIAKGVL